MPASLSLVLRGLFVAASFAGLCAAIRVRLGVDRFIAPFAAVSGIMLFLMLAGMLGVLKIGVYALYALGFAGLIYAYGLRRTPPHVWLLLTLALFAAALSLRFFENRLFQHDDFSHWALVARHMLRRDRFPGAADSFITFQSYPLGATCFIYYIARAVGNIEGVYLIAQNLLTGILLLPVFSVIERRKGALYPAAAAMLLLYLSYSFQRESLHVDDLLVAYGIGMAAALIRCRDDLRQAMIAVIPAMVAAVYIKNSGMFFSLCTAPLLILLLKRHGKYSRRRAWGIAAAPVAGYLLWTLFIKLRYPSALDTKHAISLLNYAKNLYRKGWDGTLRIAKLMTLQPFAMNAKKITFLALALACCLLLILSVRKLPAERRKEYRFVCGYALGIYLVWHISVACMYIFSMPNEEAFRLASIQRYEPTGYSYAIGILALAAFVVVQEQGACPAFRRFATAAIPLLGAASVAALALLPGNGTALYALHHRNQDNCWVRDKFQYLHDNYALPEGGAYILFFQESLDNSTMYATCSYEFESTLIYSIHRTADAPEPFEAGLRYNIRPVDDLQGVLQETMDQADALLILDESPEFEAELAKFLDTYAGDTSICRAYGKS